MVVSLIAAPVAFLSEIVYTECKQKSGKLQQDGLDKLMLIRYKTDENNNTIAVAKIYNQQEHNINNSLIDKDAFWAIRRLSQNKFEAYIVGGAVRDLLLKIVPKDFDIVTNATPRQIKRLFYDARIIGKRFKIVHLTFNNKVIEVSTFRSGDTSIYGNMEQDAQRRDFTVNSLYYDPIDKQLFDYHEALTDFKKEKIRSILPLPSSFVEDPVRMIRALKYSATTQFSLQFNIKRAIKKVGVELKEVSASRLTEEVSKILASGHAVEIFKLLQKYSLLKYLLPNIANHKNKKELYLCLERLDNQNFSRNYYSMWNSEILKALVESVINWPAETLGGDLLFKELFKETKRVISPITPPNYYVEQAVVAILKEKNIKVPKSALKASEPFSRKNVKKRLTQQKRTKKGKKRV
ncbi:MAG: poly(A) polymerase [Sphaerochaetaceae bacterium]